MDKKENDLEKLFGELIKGSYITSDMLEKYFEADKNSPEFNFGSMALQEQIRKHLAFKGEHVTVITVNYGIRILTDAEASINRVRKFGDHLKGMDKCYDGLVNVDRQNLSKEEDERHLKRLTFTGRVMDIVKDDLKKQMPIGSLVYKSIIPKLFK